MYLGHSSPLLVQACYMRSIFTWLTCPWWTTRSSGLHDIWIITVGSRKSFQCGWVEQNLASTIFWLSKDDYPQLRLIERNSRRKPGKIYNCEIFSEDEITTLWQYFWYSRATYGSSQADKLSANAILLSCCAAEAATSFFFLNNLLNSDIVCNKVQHSSWRG